MMRAETDSFRSVIQARDERGRSGNSILREALVNTVTSPCSDNFSRAARPNAAQGDLRRRRIPVDESWLAGSGTSRSGAVLEGLCICRLPQRGKRCLLITERHYGVADNLTGFMALASDQ